MKGIKLAPHNPNYPRFFWVASLTSDLSSVRINDAEYVPRMVVHVLYQQIFAKRDDNQ